MIIANLSGIDKYYNVTKVLENIDFEIHSGEKIGLIGANGAGKSTLAKILLGKLDIEEGNLYVNSSAKVGYLEQSDTYDQDITLYEYCLQSFAELVSLEKKLRRLESEMALKPNDENLLSEYGDLRDSFEQRDGYSYESKTKGILRGLGFSDDDFDRKLGTLSGGQRTRYNLAKLLLIDYDLLVLDEPTNHLDLGAMKWLEGYITAYEGAVLLISHDRTFLDRTTQKIYEIENMRGTLYHGNYSYYIEEKKRRYEDDLKRYKKNQQDIKKEEELIRTFKQRSAVSSKWKKTAEDREKKLERMEKLDKPLWLSTKMHLSFNVKKQSGNEVLRAEKLGVSFDGTEIFKNADMDIYKGDRIGLIGANGVGKTTLFRILMGDLESYSGSFRMMPSVDFSYYDQDLSKLTPENDLIDEISDAFPSMKTSEIRNYLGGFLFRGDDVFKLIDNLSGGEKARISLLKLMLEGRNLLLLDEPTNHLDILSKEALENSLLSYDGTLLAISHDRYFLNKVCNKIFELTEDGITEYLGNFDYYEFRKNEAERLENYTEPEIKSKTERQESFRKQREQQKMEREQRKLKEDLENGIHNSEDRLHTLENLLCKPDVYADQSKVLEITKEMDELKELLHELYEKWEAML